MSKFPLSILLVAFLFAFDVAPVEEGDGGCRSSNDPPSETDSGSEDAEADDSATPTS